MPTEEYYERRKQKKADASRDYALERNDIGRIPDIVDINRRNACLTNLELFCLTYFPTRFYNPFSDMHRTIMDRCIQCESEGGWFACCCPRGSGKSAIAEVSVIHAVVYGLQPYTLLVQATKQLAVDSFNIIKEEFQDNQILYEDFPEVCYPIRKLNRSPIRAIKQTLNGVFTRIKMTADRLVMPTIPGSPSSGAVVRVLPILSAGRGMKTRNDDGSIERPSYIIIDDPQTRGSAKSPRLTEDREKIIKGDLLKMSGPDTKMAVVALVTPMYEDDLAERLLNKEKNPGWNSLRVPMLLSMPTDIALLDEYSNLRKEGQRGGDGGRAGHEFYLSHQDAIEKGALASWPERIESGAVSAIETALQVYVDTPLEFQCEYQCQPAPPSQGAERKQLVPAEVVVRTNGVPRYVIPNGCSRLTAFIDLGKRLHWYAVVAWTERFAGYVVDYGCWPRQGRNHFHSQDARPLLEHKYKGLSESQRAYKGLADLVPEIVGRRYTREDRVEMKLDKLLIDAGYFPEQVFEFIRSSPYAAFTLPCIGRNRTGTSVGVGGWKLLPGEKGGHHFKIQAAQKGKGRQVIFDPDVWKSFLHERLSTALGGNGAMTLYGSEPVIHQMLAEHCAAEYSTQEETAGLKYDKWSKVNNHLDNHIWDCLVGAGVAAGVDGLVWSPSGIVGVKAKSNGAGMTLKQVQEMRRRGKAVA